MNHREQAYSQNTPNSPYLTFINTNGEFYFSTVEALFKEQKIAASYKLQFKEDAVIDSDTLKVESSFCTIILEYLLILYQQYFVCHASHRQQHV